MLAVSDHCVVHAGHQHLAVLEKTDHAGLTRKEAQGVNARLIIQLTADFQNPQPGLLADGNIRFASGKDAGNCGGRAFRELCNPADVERPSGRVKVTSEEYS